MIPPPAFSAVSLECLDDEETAEFLSEIKERCDLRRGALLKEVVGMIPPPALPLLKAAVSQWMQECASLEMFNYVKRTLGKQVVG